MKLKIYKYPLATKDSQVITLPAESTVLSIKNQHEVPVLYAAVNTACEIEGYVNIECRGTGQTLNRKEVVEITETLLFQNGNLVLHFFAQKFPQVVHPFRVNTQEELNQLMNENTIEKQKTYWTKTFDRIVKKKKWAEITIREFADLRNAGLTCYAIAEHFKVSKAVVFNYTQRNKKEYYQIFDMNEYQKNKEIWND